MSLATKFAAAIAEVIREHPEELCADDVVGLLLAMGASYGRKRIGVEKTLIQLTAQMAVVTDKDMDRVQEAVDRMKCSVAMQESNPDAALMHGVLSKISKR